MIIQEGDDTVKRIILHVVVVPRKSGQTVQRIKERDRTPVATVEVDFDTPPTVKQTDPKCQRYRKCSSFDLMHFLLDCC